MSKSRIVAQRRKPKQVPPPSTIKGKRRPLIPIAIFLSLAGLTALLFYSFTPQTAFLYPRFNVLLITVDTLRADHLGAYGYERIRTPNIDRISSKGFTFRRAIAQAPLTLPSHTTILTGTYPIYHGIRDNGNAILSEDSITLAEILKKNGYATGGFVSAFILDSKWGIAQGFDTYFDDFDILKADETGIGLVQHLGAETNAEALQWLEKVQEPFFGWIHYYDPHDPYEPPEPFRSEYSDSPYDGEIAYTDSLIGKVWNMLQERNLLKRTLIIFTGDHGEGLGQHNELTHAIFLYDTTLHVPLIFMLPEQRHKEISDTVQHVDIVPSILDMLQIEKPKTLQGRSLIPLMKEEQKKETIAVSESLYSEFHYGWSPLYSLTAGKFKYVDAPKPELFDLQKDPMELNNLYASQTQLGNSLRNRIQEELKKHSASADRQQESVQADMESQERLKALGYIGSGPSLKMATEGKKIDPKDKIAIIELLHAGFADKKKNLLEEAEKKANSVIASDPEIVDAYLLKGMIDIRKEDYPAAMQSLQTTLTLRPDHLIALYDLAVVYRNMGQPQKAIDGFKEVLRRDPNYVKAAVNLGQVFLENHQAQEAELYFKKAIHRYEEMMKSSKTVEALVSIHDALLNVYFSQGQWPEAEKAIQEILRLKPDQLDAHFNLAQIYEKTGRLEQAYNEYRSEIQIHPDNFRAYVDFAILLRAQNRYQEAVAILEKAVPLQPSHYGAKFLLADSIVESGGNLQHARTMAQQALELNPQNPRAKQLLNAINSRIGQSATH